jgi:mono/diheme cytochrome c family protein
MKTLPSMIYNYTSRVICLSLGLATLLLAASPQRSSTAETQPRTGQSLDVEPEEVRPGPAAVYRSLENATATLLRIDVKPSFYLGRSSPHPRLPPGPFEVLWSGVLLIKEPAPLSFRAFVGGEVNVNVDGVTVLEGRGTTDTSQIGPKESLKRAPGYYRLMIRYRALADVPARLQLFWESPLFAREPLPAWRLGHLPKELPPEAKQEALAAEGLAAVQRLGCARCHASALPGLTEPPPGPSLADAGRRIRRGWLLNWLDDPAKVRSDAHMPRLFAADRQGFVERWLLADYLLGGVEAKTSETSSGDHRQGRISFLSLGCAACHFVPDLPRAERRDPDRTLLTGLGDRLSAADLAAFLANPHQRYPDGRMPRLPIAPDAARNIAAYLLLWLKPTTDAAVAPPTAEEVSEALRRLGTRDAVSAATTLLRNKGCSACHSGLGQNLPLDVPIKTVGPHGCLSDRETPHFKLEEGTRQALLGYLAVAGRDRYPSPFASRQRQLQRAGCVRCHQRDSDRPPPIEEIGSTLGGAFLEELPFQRTPRLTNLHRKYTRAYLASTVREGIATLRGGRYTYRMPAFGTEAETLVQALAEADGELPTEADAPSRLVEDPTVGALHGPGLVGFQGYACISCHVWNGRQLAPTDPGNLGPDLIRTSGRLRRDWFDHFLDAPLRLAPNTPMPGIFHQNQKALLNDVLNGDPAKQKDALWSYFAQGKDAPPPKAPPPFPVAGPAPNDAPLVAQIPIRLPDKTVVESLCLLTGRDDLLIYDLAAGAPHSFYTGGQILRSVQGRLRQYLAAGDAAGSLTAEPALQLVGAAKPELPVERQLLGYDHLTERARLRWQIRFASGTVAIEETLRFPRNGDRRFERELRLIGVPEGRIVELRTRVPKGMNVTATPTICEAKLSRVEDVVVVALTPTKERLATAALRIDLPPAQRAPTWENKPIADSTPVEGSLERPGYKALAYPRPKTITGEDRVMPAALAIHPKDGRVFVASLKTGELFALHDPSDDAKQARFENYGHGLFADTLAMLAEEDGLYVLHRRNFTKIAENKSSGIAERFERVAPLTQTIADGYDYAYGLVRDKTGGFVFSYAQYADAKMPGAGSSLRFTPGQSAKELAFGFRNPLGWCVGPEGEIFFTDNQGEWVPTNKLCHMVEGRYYGYPNSSQLQHLGKPAGKTAVWVPYGWARSINGMAYDRSGGKFGPFSGQFFLAELMFGGAIIRADVEKVNGEYQGACFPFWGKGLLGPVTLAFDPRGRLFVGGITEPGWMAQPDRGALFRIDFTGQTPFEMQSIQVRPAGFRIVFTAPVDKAAAANPATYHLEHYRYEYTGAYGSPELDRTSVAVKEVSVADDGRSVELITSPLVKNRVYMITAAGVKSANGEMLVHASGAYTLNEIPER